MMLGHRAVSDIITLACLRYGDCHAVRSAGRDSDVWSWIVISCRDLSVPEPQRLRARPDAEAGGQDRALVRNSPE